MSHPPKAPRTRRHGPRICPANDAILGPCAVMVAEAHLRIEGCHVQRASRNRRSDARAARNSSRATRPSASPPTSPSCRGWWGSSIRFQRAPRCHPQKHGEAR
jgi:hypothetical protein